MKKRESALTVKTLVRNSEQRLPKTIGVIPSKQSISSEIVVNSTSSINKVVGSKSEPHVKFNVPEKYSSLKLSKKINEIKDHRKCKSLSDLIKSAPNEKVWNTHRKY